MSRCHEVTARGKPREGWSVAAASMLHLVGGPPRVGKSILAVRFARERGCGWVSTDILRELVEEHVPEFRTFDWTDPAQLDAHGRRFRPYLRSFADRVCALAEDYVIEGLEVLPDTIAWLRSARDLRAVVIGCSAPDLESIREHGGAWGVWVEQLPPADRAALPGHIAAHSRAAAAQCSELGIAFVDTAPGFEDAMRRAASVLTGPAVADGAS